MGPNRQVQIYGSKKIGSRNWFKKLVQTYRSLKRKEKKGNVTKTDATSKLKYYQNWNVTKIDKSLKLKCHQIWNVTKTEVSPKLNCHQNWSVIKTEMLPYIIFVLKNRKKIPEIGTEYIGLVYVGFWINDPSRI